MILHIVFLLELLIYDGVGPMSMVHILFPVDIVLQEDLRLVVHLGINVLTQQAANQA